MGWCSQSGNSQTTTDHCGHDEYGSTTQGLLSCEIDSMVERDSRELTWSRQTSEAVEKRDHSASVSECPL